MAPIRNRFEAGEGIGEKAELVSTERLQVAIRALEVQTQRQERHLTLPQFTTDFQQDAGFTTSSSTGDQDHTCGRVVQDPLKDLLGAVSSDEGTCDQSAAEIL